MNEKTRNLLDAAKAVFPQAYEGGNFGILHSAIAAFEHDETVTILHHITMAIRENWLYDYFHRRRSTTEWDRLKDALLSAIEAWEEKHREGDDDE